MLESLLKKDAKIAVIGLGYVGLPIALEFAKKYSVVGFDINDKRVEMMKQSIDPSNELESSAFDGCDILFTSKLDDLKSASFFVVAVPTPIDSHQLPDLKPLLSATRTVASALKKGDIVVYESTVYPGCTEDDCVPLLEQESGLTYMNDFKVGFSPERINPGDKEHTLTKILKIVSGSDDESLEIISQVYGSIIQAGLHKASSIKVAEAAKIIENTQRDVNIALMNELSMIFNKVGINTFEVLEAAGTKWNFLKFSPGLVGGHCIGVDPYYLTFKAQSLGHHAKIINAGRSINDSMGAYVARETIKGIVSSGKRIIGARMLLMGVTFKENVSDIRNSKVVDVYQELHAYGVNVDVVDPYAEKDEVVQEYGIELKDAPDGKYDAVIVAVNHDKYMSLSESDFKNLCTDEGVVVDIKGFLRGRINQLNYWSL